MDDLKTVLVSIGATWIAPTDDSDVVTLRETLADFEGPEGAAASEPGIEGVIVDGVENAHFSDGGRRSRRGGDDWPTSSKLRVDDPEVDGTANEQAVE